MVFWLFVLVFMLISKCDVVWCISDVVLVIWVFNGGVGVCLFK